MHIPPELCTPEGIPDHVRKNPRVMKDVFASCRKTPNEKMNKVSEIVRALQKMKELEEYGFKIAAQPACI